MGRETSSRATFRASVSARVSADGPATAEAEQESRKTGRLNPLVDPAGFGVIRRSLPRLEKNSAGLWELLVGPPMPIEDRLDTTGSMGGNVDVALGVLPDVYDAQAQVLPGYDQHLAVGTFGDVGDRFVLCRPQFEMHADKIVEQLTLMVPERQGGDFPEDPHYGLFGAAYLTAAHLHRLGLKSYDFTITDAPARRLLDERELVRIFGPEVFEKVAENGHQVNQHNLPTTKEVVDELLKRAHAFVLQVGNTIDTTNFWKDAFGPDRVVVLPQVKHLPAVQATIIGLTEGTLSLGDCEGFLRRFNVGKGDASKIIDSVAEIPIGAQAALPNFTKLPKKGDLFAEKDSLWPVGPTELLGASVDADDDGKVTWL